MPRAAEFFTGIAIYFVLWWLLLFTVLPWGIRGQHEDNSTIAGTEPGAPKFPHLKKKVIQTSVLTAIVCAVIFVIYYFKLISLEDIGIIPNFVPEGSR